VPCGRVRCCSRRLSAAFVCVSVAHATKGDDARAKQVYDPHDTGYVDLEVLRSIFSNLGFGEVTSEDVNVLIETADVDGDGKISLSDFRKMVSHTKDVEKDLDNLTSTLNAVKKS
jgi:hypothetical protein